MDKKIDIISNYSNKKIHAYFIKTDLDFLHDMKLYVDDLYYNTGENSGLTDEQYDILKDTLQQRDPNYIIPIGAKLRKGENRVKLPFWLGSMDKFKPNDDKKLERWLVKNKMSQYIIEDKLDGVSCLVMFKNNTIKLYTRGDGIVGSDISYLAEYLIDIPKDISQNLSIRGELIIAIDVFNKNYTEDYANPRNMVSGIIAAKTVKNGLQDINFIAYEIVGTGTMLSPTNQLKHLRSLGFNTVRHKVINTITENTLINVLEKFKDDTPYEIDGIIVQPNKEYIRNKDGNPDYAFAFKMATIMVESTVIEVLWNISKWGLLKPRIEIEPIQVGGVTIKYTTGFNAKYIVKNSIGPGARVVITRSGDVIPHIVKILSPAPEPEMPSLPYKWIIRDGKEGVDLVVENSGPTMCIKLIAGFFTKLGIKYIGEKTVKKLYDNKFDTILKILAVKPSQIEQIEGFGNKGADRICDNIKNGLHDLSLPVVLGASGIFGFGMGRERVTNLFTTIPNILIIYKKIDTEALYVNIINIDGFSHKTTMSIINNIKWADKFIKAFSKYATFKEPKQVLTGSMKGWIVVFTEFRDSKMESDIVERGGKAGDKLSVSKNTTFVITPDNPVRETKKIITAINLNIPIIGKTEFIKKYIANK